MMSRALYYITGVMLLVTIVLVGLFLRDVSSAKEVVTLDNCAPYNIQFSNILSDSFVVSWKTKSNCTGMIKYGEERDNISFVSMESGDITAKLDHVVKIEGLDYLTQYYFLVVSNQVEYGNNNSPLVVKTKGL